MYNHIRNPNTNRWVSMNTKLGKSILNNYINYSKGFLIGGAENIFLKDKQKCNTDLDEFMNDIKYNFYKLKIKLPDGISINFNNETCLSNLNIKSGSKSIFKNGEKKDLNLGYEFKPDHLPDFGEWQFQLLDFAKKHNLVIMETKTYQLYFYRKE